MNDKAIQEVAKILQSCRAGYNLDTNWLEYRSHEANDSTDNEYSLPNVALESTELHSVIKKGWKSLYEENKFPRGDGRSDPLKRTNSLSSMYRIEWTCICQIYQLYTIHIHQKTCMPQITVEECVLIWETIAELHRALVTLWIQHFTISPGSDPIPRTFNSFAKKHEDKADQAREVAIRIDKLDTYVVSSPCAEAKSNKTVQCTFENCKQTFILSDNMYWHHKAHFWPRTLTAGTGKGL